MERMFAITYHPMYLLIDEDRGEPPILERMEPWGAPDADVYIGRIERNLKALEAHQDLKLNYEFSGMELERLAQRRPDIIAQFRALIAEGRVEFVGGDYAQAHLHVLGPESSIRQYQLGRRVFKDILGVDVMVNFHQETGIHEQLPQLLRGLGFSWAVAPVFPWHAQLEDPGFEIGSWPDGNYRLHYHVPGDCTVLRWIGLDDSEVPVYIQSQLAVTESDIDQDDQTGFLHTGALWIKCPDMEELKDAEYSWMKARGQHVLLSHGLDHLRSSVSGAVRARLHSYWSYVEGMWAESLLAHITRAEEGLVAAGSILGVAAGLGISVPGEMSPALASLWRTLLGWQHHDVMWVETTDLKHKAIADLSKISSTADQWSASVFAMMLSPSPARENAPAHASVWSFNPYPYAGESLGLIPGPDFLPETQAGGALHTISPHPFELQETDSGARCLLQMGSLGPQLILGPTDSQSASVAGSAPYQVHIDHMGECTLVGEHGRELLAPGSGILTFSRPDGRTISSHGQFQELSRIRTALGETVHFRGQLDGIDTEVVYEVVGPLPALDVRYRFRFSHDEIGMMWDDETKLRCHWKFPSASKIQHDIPFGVVAARSGRPIHATSWLSASVHNMGGVQVVHYGHPKFLVGTQGDVSCPLAWGSRTFTNRMARRFSEARQYDLTLDGTFTSRFTLVPFHPEATSALQARRAQFARLKPPVITSRTPTAAAPFPKIVLADSLVCTSVEWVDSHLRLRVVNMGQELSIRNLLLDHGGTVRVNLADVGGQPLDRLPPWRIAHVDLDFA